MKAATVRTARLHRREGRAPRRMQWALASAEVLRHADRDSGSDGHGSISRENRTRAQGRYVSASFSLSQESR